MICYPLITIKTIFKLLILKMKFPAQGMWTHTVVYMVFNNLPFFNTQWIIKFSIKSQNIKLCTEVTLCTDEIACFDNNKREFCQSKNMFLIVQKISWKINQSRLTCFSADFLNSPCFISCGLKYSALTAQFRLQHFINC